MFDVSTPTRKKTWQSGRDRANLIAQMALRQTQVAETLSRLREEHGLTQEKAAEKAGVPVRQWQRWEGAETMPHPRNLDRLAAAFKITVSEILGQQPQGDTPDPFASVNGDGKKLQEQLDRIEKNQQRIERKLDKLLKPPPRLDPLPPAPPTEPAPKKR